MLTNPNKGTFRAAAVSGLMVKLLSGIVVESTRVGIAGRVGEKRSSDVRQGVLATSRLIYTEATLEEK